MRSVRQLIFKRSPCKFSLLDRGSLFSDRVIYVSCTYGNRAQVRIRISSQKINTRVPEKSKSNSNERKKLGRILILLFLVQESDRLSCLTGIGKFYPLTNLPDIWSPMVKIRRI